MHPVFCIKKSGDFMSASGPFQSGRQVLYGSQSKFDKNLDHQNNLNQIIDDASSKMASNQASIDMIFLKLITLKKNCSFLQMRRKWLSVI